MVCLKWCFCWRISWKITTLVLKTGKYYINRLPSWRNLMNQWWLLERNSIWVVATQRFLEFSALIGEDSYFDEYFSSGLKPPTRKNWWPTETAQRFCGSESCSCFEVLSFNAWIVRRSFENDLNLKSTGPTSMVSGILCCNNRGGVRFLGSRDCENALDGNP